MSDGAPFATASLEMACPIDVVAAQFFDVDHVIRAGLYHGLSLRWLPPSPEGERRVRQEMTVLRRTQVDDFVLEKGEGGAWVKRFVEGPNAGTRFVARFTSLGADRTLVRVDAFIPRGGFVFGLGKLSRLGLEKALQKLLSEHERGLTGYEPGRARGRIDDAIRACRDLTTSLAGRPEAERLAIGSNLLEAAHVIAVADGEADEAERDALRAVARGLCYVELDEAGGDRMIKSVAAAVEGQGIEARCDKIGGRLKALGVAELGVAVAALVAEVSHGIDPPELLAIERLATAAGLAEAEWTALVQRIDRILGVPASGL